jgi:hypothetical protein
MHRLWDKVESALVGSLNAAKNKFISELAGDTEYTHSEINYAATELMHAIKESERTYR